MGSVNRNRLPRPGADRTEMRPPWRSTMRLQIASPIRCRETPRGHAALEDRKNPLEVFLLDASPLSRTENRHSWCGDMMDVDLRLSRPEI